ncbi:MAG: GHKL domain-containing protein [candidate division WOR-3 bacterium]|nr:MAG: GHKL domain-containing protein [candidate division WOR-3 bacterium]
MARGMRRYLLLGIILLVLLGTFLGFGLFAGRRIMLDLIKEQARSFLSVIASTQENMIFAEARLEDELIDKMLGVCSALEANLTRSNTTNIRQSFGFHSIAVFNKKTRQTILGSGAPFLVSDEIFEQKEPISFMYFDVANETFMRFVYVVAERIYQIELSAEVIKEFRTEFGINKIMSQMSANPMVNYLVLQDTEGILFATPNIETISRIEDDPELVRVVENRIETSRIEKFNDENILELVRPFIIEGEIVGIFRIGISLSSYYRHVRRTEGQLIALFVIIFGASFLLILWLMNYQSYANIKDLFNKTLGAIEDGVLLVDQKRMITAVNEMFCTMSTFDEDFLVGNTYVRILPEDPFDIERVIKEGKKVADEKQVFGRDLRYAAYPLFDKRQRISGAIAILHDVTTIREFEREREEAERLVFLGNLVANLAHEIKNPLNGLSIGIQRLTKEFPSEDTDYVRITRSLKHEIDVLTKTVNDFLMLARPKMREKISFKIGDILNDLAPLIENSIKDKNIELNKAIGADMDLVGSPHDFRRALLNIVVNAIDAVTALKDREPKIDISLEESRGEIRLIIADNGIGMDEEERKRIFSPYYSTKKSGTGLGLYIAQKIVKDHGGSISIKSHKNTGTRFEITFHT